MENENSQIEKYFDKDYGDVADSSKNSVEMREVASEAVDKEDSQCKTEFLVKVTDSIEADYDLGDFKLKKCISVKSIFYKGEIFTSIAHPVDDENSFFIKKNKKGIFDYKFKNSESDYDESYQVHKKELVQDRIIELVRKINSIIQIDSINSDLKKIFLYKFLVYLVMTISILILSYITFFIVIYFISFFIKNHKMNDGFSPDKFFKIVLLLVMSSIIYISFKILKRIKLNETFLIFTFMLNKRNEIRLEIEYWNNTVFHPYNMKAQLAETFDYIQIFYDKNVKYEMERHTFNRYRNDDEIV
jgi:hypothetical protein